MNPNAITFPDDNGSQVVADLIRRLSKVEIERLTIDVIITHRRLVEEAERLHQSLPDEVRSEPMHGNGRYYAYVKASLDMHTQMGVVDMLITILGFIPEVTVN
jgi:hypothetical protein